MSNGTAEQDKEPKFPESVINNPTKPEDFLGSAAAPLTEVQTPRTEEIDSKKVMEMTEGQNRITQGAEIIRSIHGSELERDQANKVPPAPPLEKHLERNFLRFQLFDDSSYEALSHVALEEEAHSFHLRE